MNPEMVGANPDSPLGKVHPLMLVGIFVFVAPFLSKAINMNMPGWLSGVGVVLILLGVGLTVLGEVNG